MSLVFCQNMRQSVAVRLPIIALFYIDSLKSLTTGSKRDIITENFH